MVVHVRECVTLGNGEIGRYMSLDDNNVYVLK